MGGVLIRVGVLNRDYTVARLGRELARSTSGTDQKTSTNHLFQRLSLNLQKGNAALKLSRTTDVLSPDIMGQF